MAAQRDYRSIDRHPYRSIQPRFEFQFLLNQWGQGGGINAVAAHANTRRGTQASKPGPLPAPADGLEPHPAASLTGNNGEVWLTQQWTNGNDQTWNWEAKP